MQTKILTLALVASLATLGCGDSNGTSTTPTPQAPAVTQARISVVAANPVLTFGTTANFRVTFDLTMTESAGLGANIIFIRIEPRLAGVIVERQEIGSAAIISQTGSNRLNASSSRSANVTIEFNNGNANDILLTVGFTDDRGNNLTAPFTITFT